MLGNVLGLVGLWRPSCCDLVCLPCLSARGVVDFFGFFGLCLCPFLSSLVGSVWSWPCACAWELGLLIMFLDVLLRTVPISILILDLDSVGDLLRCILSAAKVFDFVLQPLPHG